MAAPPDDLTFYRYKRTNKAYTDDLGNGVMLTLMLIPGGEFIMGSLEGDPQSSDHERPQRLVKMPPFLIGRYPVTQALWRIVAGYAQEDKDLELNPSRFKGDDLPVEQVNWHDATEFCQRLSAKTSKNYHLPSEAEWEYACRAETTTAYYFGDQLTDEVANYHNKVGRTTPVGQYLANRWGLHDMHGNVWEWCQDHWHSNYKGAPTNGSAWLEGGDSDLRILRGGSWLFNPWYCRSAYRNNAGPGFRYYLSGFRVVCAVPRDLQPPTG
ncbi:formylglycine-generating enzyme family protein [Nodosilinea sp. LEGE 07298]|uniref:formylglycine-generating enzyme family protein n=1 Tax=Nodosilinea sp. LEGE 07298 TaxID=2777970 RepID=UPI00188066AD|nr:formylglycine-generating enzyme family protein [Nodosilinea sp. LEGE 07298]MBE9109851.1 formylglycine-generating enzyme family protein [Nodosilinea sp. LEGE 07298]